MMIKRTRARFVVFSASLRETGGVTDYLTCSLTNRHDDIKVIGYEIVTKKAMSHLWGYHL